MAAPSHASMSDACAQAAEHYRREHLQDDEAGENLQVTVDDVPHLAPGVGEATDWYKVGSLDVEPRHQILHVYLDSGTGAVKLERSLEDVVTDEEAAGQP